jgi:hypothetical protein
MNNADNKNQYTVEDSINGLTITHQGQKSWWQLILFLGILGYLLYLFVPMISDFSSKLISQSDPTLVLFFGFVFLVLGYALYQAFITGLDGLFDRERILIDGQNIQITKSGLGNIERTRTIHTDGRMCFFQIRSMGICCYRSTLLAKIYNKGLLRASNINPMRCFLRGISEDDAIAVLERIKSKYPQYDIYYHNYVPK